MTQKQIARLAYQCAAMRLLPLERLRRRVMGILGRVVRLPLLLPMGFAELCVFLVCIPLAIFKPRSGLLTHLLDWIHGLPDFGWYIGMRSNIEERGEG